MLPPKPEGARLTEDELICLLLWTDFLALPRQLTLHSGVAVPGPCFFARFISPCGACVYLGC